MTSSPVTVQGYDPRTGSSVGAALTKTSESTLDAILTQAAAASQQWADWPRPQRAEVLDRIASTLEDAREELVATADSETALGATRLDGEISRTAGQLRMFGDILRDGAYLDAVISPARPELGQPDVRRMLEPIGPVGVFAASNFPFAFSVAGGDTASALAAGCAVVVKAHEAHPSTSVQTADIVSDALRTSRAPDALFSLIHGRAAGATMVQHPSIKAVGFTGSQRGGRALFDLAAARPDPIPFHGELGSSNPVIVLPGAAAEDPTRIAREYLQSLTMGSGQFCTNPGLLFVPDDPALLSAIADAAAGLEPGVMLTASIRGAYEAGTERLVKTDAVRLLGAGVPAQGAGWQTVPQVFQTRVAQFAADRKLQEEVFGPAGLVITYATTDDLFLGIDALVGSLAAAVQAGAGDEPLASDLMRRLRGRAGRIILNGWPTGVAVVWAMHHGGPWPATTSARDTSVGGRAIQRWLAPVAFQGWPDELLPPELQADNPLELVRVVQPYPGG